MSARALGTTKQADTIDVTVAHGDRDSYGRTVIPAAKRNVARLGLWAGWAGYEATLIDTPDRTSEGECLSIVRFVRTR